MSADHSEPQDESVEDDEKGPERRCAVTGLRQSPEFMIRFVVAPDGEIAPDLENRLPGRGIWLSARRDVVNTAVEKNVFSKAARQKVRAASGLADRIDALMTRRCLEILGLARRAGQVIAGFEKVKSAVKAGQVSLLVEAGDGAEDGRDKIRSHAPNLPVITLFSGDELGQSLGRDRAVHVALTPGGLARRLKIECRRLAGFRPMSE